MKKKITIDLKGCFIYIPNEILLKGKNCIFDIRHGFIISHPNTLKSAIKALKGRKYRSWKNKFKKNEVS